MDVRVGAESGLARWRGYLRAVDAIGRRPNSEPVDPGIVEAVAGLWAAGLATMLSCGGHLPDRPPWIVVTGRFWAPGMDEELDRAYREGEGPRVRARLTSLLGEFYEHRERDPDDRLVVDDRWQGGRLRLAGVLRNRGAVAAPSSVPPESQSRIPGWQGEMSAFGSFLRDRFLGRGAPGSEADEVPPIDPAEVRTYLRREAEALRAFIEAGQAPVRGVAKGVRGVDREDRTSAEGTFPPWLRPDEQRLSATRSRSKASPAVVEEASAIACTLAPARRTGTACGVRLQTVDRSDPRTKRQERRPQSTPRQGRKSYEVMKLGVRVSATIIPAPAPRPWAPSTAATDR